MKAYFINLARRTDRRDWMESQFAKPDNHVDGIQIIKSWSWSAGAAAYVVSRRAATEIIASPWTRTVQVDRVLFNPYEGFGKSLKMRHCLPGLAVQADRVDQTINDSDLAVGRASREQAVSNRAWRVAKKLRGFVETDIIIGPQRMFHTYVGGARKQIVPFAAE
jgi:GR25 family glycosyltransferase involved in LPS biosynthesis